MFNDLHTIIYETDGVTAYYNKTEDYQKLEFLYGVVYYLYWNFEKEQFEQSKLRNINHKLQLLMMVKFNKENFNNYMLRDFRNEWVDL